MAKKWTKEEEEMLSKIHHMYTNDELAEIFGVTSNAIRCKKNYMKLRNERLEIPYGYKKCNSCNSILPVSEFHKKTATKDGFQAECITCKKEYKRKVKIDFKNKIEKKEKEEKLKKYIAERKDMFLFCEVCNEEKKIEDYYIYVKQSGTIDRQCIKCKGRKAKDYKIKRAIKKGY